MKAIIIEIECTFPRGNLNEDMYMDVPPGLDIDNSQKYYPQNNLRSSSE
jgi:hypothetical protein